MYGHARGKGRQIGKGSYVAMFIHISVLASSLSSTSPQADVVSAECRTS